MRAMRRRVKPLRRKQRRRRLGAERLEDRRLLAALDLVPDAAVGTITEEGGTTVVTVAAGATVKITAQVATAESDVQGFQLNLSSSDGQLTLDNYVNGTDFPIPADSALDSSATH